MNDDPGRYIKYALNWSAEMQERVAALSNAREMPMSVWIREAIREKLARDEPEGQS